MGPTRKRDLAIGTVLATIAAYGLVVLVYGWLPPITVWTGLSLLVFAGGEAGWAFYVRAKIRAGDIGVGGGRIHPLAVAYPVMVGVSMIVVAVANHYWHHPLTMVQLGGVGLLFLGVVLISAASRST